MDNLLTNILTYFTDKTRSFGSKSLFLLTVLFLFLVFDYFTGLSFYISTSYKLNQIEKVERIKTDYPDNERLINDLNKIENEILTRKTIQDYFSFFDISNFEFVGSDSTAQIQKNDSLTLKTEKDKHTDNDSKTTIFPDSTGRRSNLIHILTSSYSFVFFLILLPFVLFTDRKFDRNMIVGLVFMAMMLVGLVWFFSYLFSLIPLVKYPLINYLINFALHTLFLILMGLIFRTKKKATE
jgi:hypothetical protein